MPKLKQKTDSEKLDMIADLLRYSIIIQLADRGITQEQIAKKLKMQTLRVNEFLKGSKQREE